MRNLRASLTLMLLTGAMTACGGGGGGGSGSPAPAPPPVNTTPPTASISAITPAQRVTSQSVSFAGAGTTPVANGVLTYSWNFGDGATGIGANTTHIYTAHGSYTVSLTVRDSGNLSTTTTQDITVVAPPAAPVLTVDDFSVTPGSNIAVVASATDPQGSPLTYSWEFGDGGTAMGPSASHAYANEGDFIVRATATNSFGLSTTATSGPVSVAWLPMVPPSIIIQNSEHLLGQSVFAWAAFLEPNGLNFTLDWDFGDGTIVRTTDPSQRATHTYAGLGSHTVRLTATNSAGRSVTATRAVDIQPVVAPPAPVNDVLQVYCAGSYCGASSPSAYSGGIGIWRYHNSTGAPATINIAISGVTPGSPATLVFSNGLTTATTAPDPGTSSVQPGKASMSAAAGSTTSTVSHESILEANRALAASLPRGSGTLAPAPRKSTVARTRAAVPVGTTRTWHESAYTNQTYNLVVGASCEFSTGRWGVIWIDANQQQRGEIAPRKVQNLADTLCGPQGAYELLVNLHGDLWGPAPAQYVQDTATLQDIHIVIPGVPRTADFGGYFGAGSLLNTTSYPASNAAVAVVLNGWVLANYPVDDRAMQNTLVHELKHLLNFYQRTLVRGDSHDSWLEETSAMLAEGLISPRVAPFSARTEARVSGYIFSGGAIGYTGWTHPQGNSYNLGGAFGTFLHRRYGASFDRELITMCNDGGAPDSSYQCVQDYIVRHGGRGFEDEFARMGASALGGIPASGVPSGFGFPGLFVEGAPLEPIGSAFRPTMDVAPTALNGSLGATTQTYSRQFIAPGQSTYTRSNLVVPAGTTLLLVIAPPAT